MTFAGLSRGQQRADVIDFLNTLSDKPLPMPKAAENAPPAAPAGAPAAGAPAAKPAGAAPAAKPAAPASAPKK
jgi:cytochrome c